MKKLISLLLTLVLSLSLFGCGAEPTPAPDQMVSGLLAAVLKDDFAPLQELFGYKTAQEAADDLLDGIDLQQSIMDGATESLLAGDIALSEADTEIFVAAFVNAIARCPITCQTVSMDEQAGIAMVCVTVNTYSSDVVGSGLVTAIQPVLLANLDKINDEQAMYGIVFRAAAEYLDGLVPTDETVSFDVPCVLDEDTIKGKTRTVWLPEDEAALGEMVATSVFPS